MATSEQKIRFAVIGVGLIGPRHARTVAKNPRTTLVAIVDPAPAGKELATELNVAHYASVDDLVQSPHIPEAAIVCTPNHTHVNIPKQLASHGIHPLIEKPISSDVPSGLDLLHHLKQTGVKALVGHHRRFNPYMCAAKSSLDAGDVGKIIAVNGVWALYKPDDYFEGPGAWRKGKDGGVILINMIHEVDILHYLLGPIVRVYAEKTMSERGQDAEEGAALTLRFRSGVVGSFLISDNTPSPFNFEAGTGENPLIPETRGTFYQVFGTDGTLSVPNMGLYSYQDDEKSWHSNMTTHTIHVGKGVPFEMQLSHFCHYIRGEVYPMCTPQAGLAALIVCEAIKQSIESNTTVDIPEYEL